VLLLASASAVFLTGLAATAGILAGMGGPRAAIGAAF
jgi:hypothetical protein